LSTFDLETIRLRIADDPLAQLSGGSLKAMQSGSLHFPQAGLNSAQFGHPDHADVPRDT
jgi:hypothetical protein